MKDDRSKAEEHDSTSIDKLPIDVLLKIFSYLTPQDVSSVSQVNRLFHNVEVVESKRAQRFWKEKFMLHFPRTWPDNADQQNFNWFNAFKEIYEHKYQDLSPRMRQFFSAVKEGDLDLLKRYHEAKPYTIEDTFTRDADYWKAIDNAPQHQDILDFLYNTIILPYYENYSVQHTATYEDTGLTLLHWAARLNQTPDVIRQLLADGSVLNARARGYGTALSMAAECGHCEVVKVLLANETIDEASLNDGLVNAAREGKLDVVKTLLTHEATNVNSTQGGHGMTALFCAATNGHVEVVRNLLAQEGVLVNLVATNEYFYGTALHSAIKQGNIEIVSALLEHKGINVNEVDMNGATALHIAVENNQLDVVNALLLLPNLDVNAVRTDGATALAIAVERGQPEIVKALKINLLEKYIAERGREDAPMYKTSKSFFGQKIDFGYSKDQKVKAAKAKLNELKGVAGNVSKEDEKILNQGTTKTIVSPKINRRR